MTSLKFAVLDDVVGHLEYGMGLDYTKALRDAGVLTVEVIPYKRIYQELGLSRCMVEIRRRIEDKALNVLLWNLDDGFEFDPRFFADLQAICFNIVYIGDDEHYFDRSTRYYAQGFDLVLVANILNVHRYQMLGIESRFLPSSFDVSEVLPSLSDPRPQVSFVGALDFKVDRREYLSFLSSNGIDVSLYGTGTPGGVVTRQRMNEIFRSSKISLNFTGVAVNNLMDYDLLINRRMKQVKGRSQEIALAGGFVLSEYVPGIEYLFAIGTEIDIFRSQPELLNKIRYYLSHDDVRETMAARAHERAIRDYDAKHQWIAVLKQVCEMIPEKFSYPKFPMYLDPIFLKSRSAFHLSLAVKYLVTGKLRNFRDELLVLRAYPRVDAGLAYRYLRRNLIEALGSVRWLRSLVRRIKGRR